MFAVGLIFKKSKALKTKLKAFHGKKRKKTVILTVAAVSVAVAAALTFIFTSFVFAAGVSTGGSDIIVRLLKLRWRNVPIGVISMAFDSCVAVLTGLVYGDIRVALYSGVAIFVTGKVIDVVVYRFDYSKVALIITKEYDAVVQAISDKLERGATFLHGEGTYSHTQTKVILTAIKRQQMAELKALVVELDPNAFIIMQEAHQVLGDGFLRYNKDSL